MKSEHSVAESIGAVAVVILLGLAIAGWLLHSFELCRDYETERERSHRAHPEWASE